MAKVQHLAIIFNKNKLFSAKNFIDSNIINRINNMIYNNL